MVQAYNPSTAEGEVGGSQVQGQPAYIVKSKPDRLSHTNLSHVVYSES